MDILDDWRKIVVIGEFDDVCRDYSLTDAKLYFNKNRTKIMHNERTNPVGPITYGFNIACMHNRLDIARWLYSLNVMKPIGLYRGFVSACEHGNLEIVKWIYSNGYNSFIHKNDDEAYMKASYQLLQKEHTTFELKRRCDVVVWLIDHGVRPNEHQFDSYKILQVITEHNYPKVIDAVRSGNYSKLSPIIHESAFKAKFIMFLTCQYGKLTVAKYLLNCGLKPDIDNFHTACIYGNLPLAEWIYPFTHPISSTELANAYKGAVKNKHDAIIKFLIRLGIKPEVGDPNYGYYVTYRDRLITTCTKGDLVSTRDLYATAGSERCSDNLRLQKQEGEAFIAACSNGHYRVARYLRSIAREIPERSYQLAMIDAAVNGHSDIVRWLLYCGVTIRVLNDEPFRKACKSGHLSLAKWLHSVGADVNANNGEPLITAISDGNVNLVKWLHSVDAEFNVNNDAVFRMICNPGYVHSTVREWIYATDLEPKDLDLRCTYISQRTTSVTSKYQDEIARLKAQLALQEKEKQEYLVISKA